MKQQNQHSFGILKRKGSKFAGLLLMTLVGSLTSAQAGLWGFNFIKAPTGTINNEESGEILRLTGSGTFDPVQQTVTATGSFTVFNAAELGGNPGHGTWAATSFVGFDPDGGPNPGLQGGTLTFNCDFTFSFGFVLHGSVTVICPFVDGAFQEDGDGFVAVFGDETFVTEPGTATGSTVFHILQH